MEILAILVLLLGWACDKELQKITPERDKAFKVAVKENRDLPKLTDGGENISQDVRNKVLARAIENNIDPERIEKLAKIAELNKAIHRKKDGKNFLFQNVKMTPIERARKAGNQKAEEILKKVEDTQTKAHQAL